MPRRSSGLTDLGLRVVTALTYAQKTKAELAKVLQIDSKTLQRTLRGRREFRDDEIQAVLRLTGVPERFLREGFSADGNDQPASPDLQAQVEAVLGVVRETRDLVARLAAEQAADAD